MQEHKPYKEIYRLSFISRCGKVFKRNETMNAP